MGQRTTRKKCDEIARCRGCGQPIVQQNRRGRTQIYCSSQCRNKANNNNRKRRIERQKFASESAGILSSVVVEKDRQLMWQLDEINRLRADNEQMLGELKRISNDMAALLEAQVVSIDRSTADPRMLERHSGIIPIMEKYEERDLSPIKQQEQIWDDMKQRHRSELDRATKAGRNETYMNAVFSRHRRETEENKKRCSAYLAWRDLQWRRQDIREQYGVEYMPDRPNDRMARVGDGSGKENDHVTGRPKDRSAQGAAARSGITETENRKFEEAAGTQQRRNHEGIPEISERVSIDSRTVRMEGEHGNQAWHQTAADNAAGNGTVSGEDGRGYGFGTDPHGLPTGAFDGARNGRLDAGYEDGNGGRNAARLNGVKGGERQ